MKFKDDLMTIPVPKDAEHFRVIFGKNLKEIKEGLEMYLAQVIEEIKIKKENAK